MLTLRPAGARGHAQHGWLNSRHTFSFADYHDPRYMGFRNLRVINDDQVAPGRGFGTHPHRDMEIISYVLDGALEHKDSMGTGSIIRPYDVQRMSAGTGVTHSEFNASRAEPVHFLQIWILPGQRGIAPSYEQRRFEPESKRGCLRLIVSPEGADGSVSIHADAKLYSGLLAKGEKVEHTLATGRHAWLHVASGSVRVDGYDLKTGDGAAISDVSSVKIEGLAPREGDGEVSDVLLFDLP